jgi:hypothetical protein
LVFSYILDKYKYEAKKDQIFLRKISIREEERKKRRKEKRGGRKGKNT